MILQSVHFTFTNIFLLAFLPGDVEQERPVDIPDPWAGPRIYAEDFYAGGDVRVHPGQEINPSLLEDAMQDDTTSQIVTPDGQSYEEGPIDDEEQFDDELEYDEEAVIQPPTSHTFVPASRFARRALPIPTNAEFISIEDSDEEIDLKNQEPINLGSPNAVEVEFRELQHENIDEQDEERQQSLEVDEIVKEDTIHVPQPIPQLNAMQPSKADIPIATRTLSSSSGQQDAIPMDHYESIYANIETVTMQAEDQAGNYFFFAVTNKC